MKAEREAYAEVVGADGWALLTDLYAGEAPLWLREVPAVETLRRVWVQQYIYVEGTIRWRDADSTPPSARMISSPYDSEAHYARKRSTSWIGYKVHLTERNVSIALRHLGEKFRLQEEARLPLLAAAAAG